MRRPEELTRDAPLRWSAGSGNDVWALFQAVIAGDLAAVVRLVEKDPSLPRSHYNYRTPIYFAVRENRVEIARFLLARGADPASLAVGDSLLQVTRDRGYAEMEKLLEHHIATKLGGSLFGEEIAAAIRGHDLGAVRRLLDASPGLLNAGDLSSNKPIHWATMTRQIDMIDELLARGADINATRGDHARPIHLSNGDYGFRGWRDVPADWPTTPSAVLGHLIGRGAYVDINTACSLGNVKRVRQLLDDDPGLANRVSDYLTYYIGSGTPLRNAAAMGHIDVVKLLLERGADPNVPEEGIAPHGHALYSAVYNGHYEIARLLLDHGAYSNPEVESSADALWIAIANSDERMIDLLVAHGATWNIPNTSKRFSYEELAARIPRRSLEVLAAFGDVRAAETMFAQDPALANDPGALGSAARSGHEPFVRLLLRHHPDLPARMEAQDFGLDAGTVMLPKQRELTDLLFRHGLNPSTGDWLNIAPLHRCAAKNDIENAALLLDRGADIHGRDEDIQSTPLGWAAKFGHRETVEFLLSRGASLTRPDDPPWATPLAWAKRRGHKGVVDLLTERGRSNGSNDV